MRLRRAPKILRCKGRRLERAEQLSCWNCPGGKQMGDHGPAYLDGDGVPVVDVLCPVCGDRWTVAVGA